MATRRWLCLVLVLGFAAPVRAQAPTDLVSLVPRDFGLCVAINDLRGNWQRLDQSAWLQRLRQSPLGQALVASKEMQDLARLKRDLKTHLEIDWPTVRDDLLGDACVLAYRPQGAAPTQPEQGLFLARVRRPDTLVRLIERVNVLQKEARELTTLEVRERQGVTYYRRVHQRNTHFYLVQGNLFVLASQEAALHAVIDRQGGGANWTDSLRRAEAERAFVAFALNPRAFDEDLKGKAGKATGPEAKALTAMFEHWRALDAVVIALDAKDDLELRLALLVRTGDLPAPLHGLFTRRPQASALWQRLPADSIFTVAGRTDFRAMADGLLELAPKEARKFALESIGKTVGAALGLDFFQDVLPNLGPDWGVCVLPASAGKEFPQALVALAIKPGDKDAAVDQALYKALQFFAGLAILDHNLKNTDHIRLRTLHQGAVEVKYLAQDKLFPAGFQPACALKDGYLVLATSPAAIALFQPHSGAPLPGAEAPWMRVAPAGLAQLARMHRARLIEKMTQKEMLTPEAANQNLDGLLALLDVCRQITFSQRSADGQLAWTIRLHMSDAKMP